MCWPKAKLLQRTSHSAQLTQMKAGYLCQMSAMTSSASTTSLQGVCIITMSAGKRTEHPDICLTDVLLFLTVRFQLFWMLWTLLDWWRELTQDRDLEMLFFPTSMPAMESSTWPVSSVFSSPQLGWNPSQQPSGQENIANVLCNFNSVKGVFLMVSALFLQVHLMTRTSFTLRATSTLYATLRSFTKSCG